MAYNPADYEPVETRLEKYWEEHPYGSILTELVHFTEDRFICKATAFMGTEPPDALQDAPPVLATGHAEEYVTERGVNKTSALENCETSAIGRALANAGYAARGKRPSREEMDKVNRGAAPNAAPVTKASVARDELREFCRKNDIDMNAVVAAYAQLNDGATLIADENADRIKTFTALLKLDPNAVLKAEEVKT